MGILDEYVVGDSVVLDAGCGSGFFSRYFVSRGCRAYSLDYSARALEIARDLTENRSERYIERDLLDKSLSEEFIGYFDIIFTDGVFEHFAADQQSEIIDGFMRMKKENGLIVTFVPNRFTLWRLLRPLLMPGIREVPFTAGRLRDLHHTCRILKSGGVNALPVKWSPDRWMGRYVGMLLYVVGV